MRAELQPDSDPGHYSTRPHPLAPFEAIRRMFVAIDALGKMADSFIDFSDLPDPMQIDVDLCDELYAVQLRVWQVAFEYLGRYRYQLPAHKLRITVTTEGGDDGK